MKITMHFSINEQTRHSIRSRCIISLVRAYNNATRRHFRKFQKCSYKRKKYMSPDRVFCSCISRNERYLPFSPSKNKPDLKVLVPKVILFVSEYRNYAAMIAWSLAHSKRNPNRQIHYLDDKTRITQKNFTTRDNWHVSNWFDLLASRILCIPIFKVLISF